MTTLKSNLLKKGKKGFTLTELAIVIAVIAILIAVLVPTFTSVINNAKKTTASENATHAITAYTLVEEKALEDNSVIEVKYDSSTTYYFVVTGGSVGSALTEQPDNISTLTAYNFTDEDYATTFEDITIYYVSSEGEAAKTLAETAIEAYTSVSSLVNATVYAVVTSGSDTYIYSVSVTGASSPYTATATSISYNATLVSSLLSGTYTSIAGSTIDSAYSSVTIYYAS